MAETAVTSIHPRPPLPRSVRIEKGGAMTPNEMRLLKEATGRTLTELLSGDAEDMDQAPDRLQSMVFIQLRREGYDVTWLEAGDVAPDFKEETPDPSVDGSSNPSSPSAVSGA